MTESVGITIDLAGDDVERAGEVYDAVEALLFRMGEIGTLSMRSSVHGIALKSISHPGHTGDASCFCGGDFCGPDDSERGEG